MKAWHFLQVSSEIIGKNRYCSDASGTVQSTHGETMPEPRRLTIDEIIKQLDDPTLAVLDTRADRAAFMRAHLPGSLYAPANHSFSDFAGSYLRPDDRIVLVVDSADRVGEQVRRLIQLGFDKIEGWLPLPLLLQPTVTLPASGQ